MHKRTHLITFKRKHMKEYDVTVGSASYIFEATNAHLEALGWRNRARPWFITAGIFQFHSIYAGIMALYIEACISTLEKSLPPRSFSLSSFIGFQESNRFRVPIRCLRGWCPMVATGCRCQRFFRACRYLKMHKYMKRHLKTLWMLQRIEITSQKS